MPRFIDRTGQKFGKLTVLSRQGTNQNKKVLWGCLCDCGNKIDVVAGALVTGNTTSCGCITPNYKHGGTGKGSYNSWRAMLRRCTVESDKDYPRWGGAGVTICKEWLNYETFAADMGEPTGNQTLDRIDPASNYHKENCRWADAKTQARNIRVKANSKTGVTGVSIPYPGKYMAKVTVGKKAYYSQCFSTIEEAALARKELERLHWQDAA